MNLIIFCKSKNSVIIMEDINIDNEKGTTKIKLEEIDIDDETGTTEIKLENFDIDDGIGNTTIKLEDIDIKEEIESNFSENEIYGDYDIHQDSNTLALAQSKVENINLNNESIKMEDISIFSPIGFFNDSRETYLNYPLIHQGNSSQTFSNAANHRRKTANMINKSENIMGIMVETIVNNEGIYIPIGWKRKLYKRKLSTCKKIFCIKYINPNGEAFSSEAQVNSHLSRLSNNFYSRSIYVDKMDFSVKNMSKRKSKCNNVSTRKSKCIHKNAENPIIEVNTDNTGIYIPKGWQRKVSLVTFPDGRKMLYPSYYNKEGKAFWNKTDVSSYISLSSGKFDSEPIDLERMNFTKELKNPV